MNGTDTAIALRQIADWFAEHPDVKGPYDITVAANPGTLEMARRIHAALGAAVDIEDPAESNLVVLSRDFAGIKLRFLSSVSSATRIYRSGLVGPVQRAPLDL